MRGKARKRSRTIIVHLALSGAGKRCRGTTHAALPQEPEGCTSGRPNPVQCRLWPESVPQTPVPGHAPPPLGPESMTKDPPRTALVLQGGGALGAFECGVLKALYESRKNFQPA